MSEASTKRHNWLLASVEPDIRTRFADKLRVLELPKGRTLLHQGEDVDAVYFPEGALIGLMSSASSGDNVQTAMVGWDGALGVFEACGSRRSAFDAEVQVAGPAWQIAAGAYRDVFHASEALRVNVHKYVEVLLTEARQHAACNAVHSVESRLSRSILEALERSQEGRGLPVTQEAVADMLGVQRTTITACLTALQASGAVRTTRGLIEVLDKASLERAACACRSTLQTARREIYASNQSVCDA